MTQPNRIRTSCPSAWVRDLLEDMGPFVDLDALQRELGDWGGHHPAHALRVPLEQVARAFDIAERLSGDALLGLHLAERVRARGVAHWLARSQETLWAALQELCRFQHLLFTAHSLTLVPRGRSVALVLWPPAAHASRHLTEYFVASLCTEARRVTDPPWSPEGVRFRHRAAGDLAEYGRVLGCSVAFAEPEHALDVAMSDLDRPMLVGNAQVAELVRSMARRPQDISAETAMRERVEIALRAALLSVSDSGPAAIAAYLGLGPSELAQGLHGDDTSFDELLDEVRREVAEELIANPVLTGLDVALRCGFPDLDTLRDAFVRWRQGQE